MCDGVEIDAESGLALSDLPLSVESITTDWLTHVLSAHYPGTVVTELLARDARPGFATKVRLHLAYNQEGRAHGLPEVLWMKGGFNHENQNNLESYIAEARFFAFWGRNLSINKPRCVFEGIDRRGRQGLVMLEDLNLRGVSFGRAEAAISPDAAARVVELQAGFHAAWWCASRLNDLRSFSQRQADPGFLVRRMLKPAVWVPNVNSERGRNFPVELKEPAIATRAYEALWSRAETGRHTFLHGDAHLENYYFERDGTPGAADWQAYVRGPSLVDVSYFLCGALEIDDRRRHERSLIAHYLEALKQAGVEDAPTFDEAWQDYPCCALHGLCRVASVPGGQTEEAIRAYSWRYGAACADLDTVRALGVQ
jgi:Ecdysteroid kinase-like family